MATSPFRKIRRASAVSAASPLSSRFAEAILDVVGHVPTSSLSRSGTAAADSQRIAVQAARKAATTAGALSLPPGPLGWLTILPDLIAVWRIQAQLVADVAALHGKTATLTREQVLWCLFKHGSSQALKDLLVRSGSRVLVKRATLRMLQRIALSLGVKVTQRGVARAVARWVPLLGAGGVALYAHFDTKRIGTAAIELFASDIELVESPAH